MSGEACLHCDQTREQIKRNKTICGIEGGYEYVEIVEEWPRHRWQDWADSDLIARGIKPEAFEAHRRTQITNLQWAGCDDLVRGHCLADEKSASDMGVRPGQCMDCGWKP